MHRIVILLASIAPLFAQTEFELSGRYWDPDNAGRLRVERGGFGTEIDMERDLGFSKTGFPQGVLSLQHGRSKLTFRYAPLDYSGDQTVTRTILFRGQQYTVGTRVQSDLEVRHLQLGWAYQFIRAKGGAFRLGPLVEADGFLMKGRLAAPALNTAEEEKISVGLPTVGVAMDI